VTGEERHRLRLSTGRLDLVPVSAADTTFLHALWADPDGRRFLWDDRVISRDEAAAAVEASLAAFRRDGFGLWVVALRPQLVPIGFCGLRHFTEAGEVEILYGLAPAYWGRGLATEAAASVLRFAFERAGLVQVFAGTDAPNAASQRVIERLGMTYHGQRTIGGVEAIYFSVDAPSFAASMRTSERQPATVLFVCEHGAAKSVVAAAYFNSMAGERGLPFQAISRGTDPDAAVHPAALAGLAADGLVAGGEPAALSSGDLAGARHVVAFSPLPPAYGPVADVDVWSVPPVSEDYELARSSIVERIAGLLDELARDAR
jgi:RimJ/RimL family protein N-acetyltransferase